MKKDIAVTGRADVPVDPAITEASTTVATVPVPVAKAVAPLAAGYNVEGVGTGFEDFTQDDLAVPFLSIMQKGSPQVEEDNPKYIKGAKAGMLMDTVSSELFDGKAGLAAIPVHRHRCYIEWIPKDDGGGLVNVFEPDAPEVRAVLAKAGRKFGKLKINDNNDLVETFNVFCLIPFANGTVKRIVMSMASSQIPVYKKWMTRAQSIQVIGDSGRPSTPPLFSHVYLLKTEFFQKKENTWYKWKVDFNGVDAAACRLPAESELYEQAKQFRAMLISGAAQADFGTAQQEAADPEADYSM